MHQAEDTIETREMFEMMNKLKMQTFLPDALCFGLFSFVVVVAEKTKELRGALFLKPNCS